ncbi:MAG: hypothetical protein K5662_03895 [Lachnospiraceae bacterium]|nr:hypothetical protein [Lachnospiraceae bacterium]
MKCRSCGGEISLTDKVCPYCGRPLEETIRHRSDMEKYNKENEKAKARTGKAASENLPIVISVLIMLVLIIGIGVSRYIIAEAYHFRSDALRKESKERYEEYEPIISDYLNEGDYTGFAAFINAHNIATYDTPYNRLDLLNDMAKEYTKVVNSVECACLVGEEAKQYLSEDEVYSCRMAIESFYQEYNDKKAAIEKDAYRDHIVDMEARVGLIMEIYLGMDAEERTAYLAGSVNEQEAYLEEVILGE